MKASGFTLPELLVSLAIVGILTAIAWPGYGAVMRRAQRDEARLALFRLQHAEELHYQGHLAYSAAVDAPVAEGGLGLTPFSASGSYQLAVELRGSGQRYLASARPRTPGPQATDADCSLLTIDETGQRSATDAGGRDTTALCWR